MVSHYNRRTAPLRIRIPSYRIDLLPADALVYCAPPAGRPPGVLVLVLCGRFPPPNPPSPGFGSGLRGNISGRFAVLYTNDAMIAEACIKSPACSRSYTSIFE